jgi:nitrogen-specific signal transduction histidine kinase
MQNIYKTMAESAASLGSLRENTPKPEPAEHIPLAVAHELNNIITIIRGYADRLLSKHNQDPALEPHLKLISDAARRAGLIVRDAMPPDPLAASRSHPSPPPSAS